MEKLDIHDCEGRRKSSLRLLNRNEHASEKQINDFARFFELCELGKLGKKKSGNHRILSYMYNLNKLLDYFKKDLDKISEKDFEIFYKDLDTNKIKRRNGKPYTNNSKNDLVKSLKKYLRFAYNDEVKFRKMVGWIKNYDDTTEIPALSLEETKKLASKAGNIRDQALIMFLFDSGCRIEEALNLKIESIQIRKDKEKGQYYVVDIKHTKTLPRKISVPICSALVTEWLKEHPERNNIQAPLFPLTYDGARIMLTRLAQKVLGKKITLHQLRHSSASYYCKKINNPFKFVYRYGWTINSDQSKRYIDRSQLEEDAQEELVNYIKNDKLESQEKEIAVLTNKFEEMQKLTQEIKKKIEITETKKLSFNKLKGGANVIESRI